ncbi:endonuclease/exonuclease/phosphatase family protein [Actomonas aquatica]|uniref:Endonuclease/exonuclease/phosphatase family protein n=1 Tax=Actomonas aquatica TaxID=2866162 RepID=A0ABZ1CAX7_9BACT|nr:endonuclease/exonuclease/phosphatase family protein [Opitutus sp. WL0086]WRQ88701.1 endonuclease/exonuclease/phosphatase family protein [Opitutus sp. WL0086]
MRWRRGRPVLALVLSLIAVAVSGATEGLPREVSVATYNVANYNLTDRQIEGAFMTQYPKPEREKTALRRVIAELDADVLALQEVGDESFLRELRRDLRSDGLDYPHAYVLEAADRTRRLAVLSRLPFTHVGQHRDLSFKYFEGRELVKRGLLEVRFATAAGEVTLFVVHLKSRLTERRDDPQAEMRRGREATAVRDRILELLPEPATARFLIVGDFNEGPTGRPLRAFSQRGPLEIAREVPASDSRGETWTHLYRRNDEYTRVDYVMVSPLLESAVRDGQAVILDSAPVLRASDHRPVKVMLELGEL